VERGSQEWMDALRDALACFGSCIVECQECGLPGVLGYACPNGCEDSGTVSIDFTQWLDPKALN